ncbi:MAG: phospholipid-binding protein MlaC [Thiohalomonadales bacterium]
MIGKQAFNNKLFTALLLLLSINATSVLAANATSELKPDEILHKATNELLVVINRDREKIKKNPDYVYDVVKQYLIPHVDFVSAARWVLGKYERTASKEEKIQFILEFRTLMIRFYATALREYLINNENEIKKEMIRYYPVTLKEGATQVIVRSEIVPTGSKKVPVNFHMHLKKGKWKVFDVSVDGVSIVTTYQTSFSSQIRKKGLSNVIAALKKRNAGLKEPETGTTGAEQKAN